MKALDDALPLHLAAEFGHPEILSVYLARRPDLVAATCTRGRTALHLAAKSGHANVVKQLLTLDPDLLDMSDDEGETALDLASEMGRSEALALLLDYRPFVSPSCFFLALERRHDDWENVISMC